MMKKRALLLNPIHSMILCCPCGDRSNACYVCCCSFAMMKKGALLLNVSRGGLVDSDEMMHALERAQLGGVGLDVWENEADMFFTDW
jgi:D-lactate dehydrogenase